MEHENVDTVAPGHRVDRRRAGIARGCPDNGQMVIAARQEFFKQQAEQLQRDILERQGGAVEQFEQPLPFIQLAQRGDRGVGKPAIGLLCQFTEALWGQAIADERQYHPLRQFGIRQAGHRRDLVSGEARPGFGDIEPAVAGQAGERGPFEIKRRCVPARADIFHRSFPRLSRAA